MKQNWFLLSAILAVLAIPFGLALFEDSTAAPQLDDSETRVAELQPLTVVAPSRQDNGDLAAWTYHDPLDLRFIDDFLAPSPGLSADLLAAVVDRSSLREFVQRSGHTDVSLMFKEFRATIPTIELSFDKDRRVYQQLVNRWGAPTLSTAVPDQLAAWLTEDVRAVSDAEDTPQRLVVGPYTQFDKILAHGFFGRVQGNLKTIEDVIHAFPDHHLVRSGDEIELSLLPIEESRDAETVISLSFEGRRLRTVSTTVDFSLAPQRRDQILATIARRFGRSTHGDSEELSFVNHPGLSLFVYPTRIVIYQDL